MEVTKHNKNGRIRKERSKERKIKRFLRICFALVWCGVVLSLLVSSRGLVGNQTS
jgi:hypothetical protein